MEWLVLANAASLDVLILAALAGAVAAVLASVARAHIHGRPARLLAEAELERARAGLPSNLVVRLTIDLKERETVTLRAAQVLRSRLGG
jgi:hypothetical protein